MKLLSMGARPQKTFFERVHNPHPVILVILGLLIAATMVAARPSQSTFLLRSIFNAGHAPLFVVLTLICFALVRRTRLQTNPAASYQVTFGLMFLAAFGTELAQIPIGRDAEMMDVNRDLLGILAALLLIRSFDPAWRRQQDSAVATPVARLPRSLKWLMRVLAVGLIVLPFLPAVRWAAAYDIRNTIFPRLVDFSEPLGYRFVSPENANFSVVPAPAAWTDHQNQRVGRVTFLPTVFPQIYVDEIYPDWQGYHQLGIELFNTVDTAISVVVRIHDQHHNQDHSDRYNERFTLAPGPNRIEIPLERVQTAPATREMDMAALQTLILFAYDVLDTFSIYVGEMRLE